MKVLSKDALIALINLRIWDSLSMEDVEELFEKYGDDYSAEGELLSESPNAERRDMFKRLVE